MLHLILFDKPGQRDKNHKRVATCKSVHLTSGGTPFRTTKQKRPQTMDVNEASNPPKGNLKKYIYMPPQRSLISELLQKQLEMEKASKESCPCQKDSSYFNIDLQLATLRPIVLYAVVDAEKWLRENQDSRESQSVNTAIESLSHEACGIITSQSPTTRTARSPELPDLDAHDRELRDNELHQVASKKPGTTALSPGRSGPNAQDAVFTQNHKVNSGEQMTPDTKASHYCFEHWKQQRKLHSK
ncbi:hypothetical protein Tcan_18171 [Toxocara canis]|uniref:Uncharacterized protein n=1 Tax=Toxocara canis TaxID=6265 RepID=A0A0B2V3G0_TOXCA|nr:hypothetical protein Tcan_18171 [Toxocara canis]